MALRSIIHFASVPAFLIVAAVFLWQLDSDNGRPELPLMVINDPIPDFDLPPVEGSEVPGFSSTDLRAGEIVLVNVFASWCFPCRTEPPLLMRIRSEEHTSEVQSLMRISYAVFCLKKKTHRYLL